MRIWRVALVAIAVAGMLPGVSGGSSADSDETASALAKARRAANKERHEKAIGILKQIDDKHCSECKVQLARSYAATQRFDKAVEVYRALLAALPAEAKPVGLYSELGSSLFNLAYLPSHDEYREAVRLHEAIGPADGFDPGWIEAWDERRIRYLNEARDAFDTALGLSGDNSDSLKVSLAEVYFRLGQKDEVHQLLEDFEGAESVPAKVTELVQCVNALSDPEPVPPTDKTPSSITPPIRKNIGKRSTMPQYNDAAREAKVEGVVELEMQIGKDGKSHCIRILRSLPLLDLAAYRAASNWRWEPATLNGEPVSVLLATKITFALEP